MFYQKAKPGEDLEYPAALHNDLLEMLDWFKRTVREGRRTPSPEQGPGGLCRIKVRNDSGADRNQYDVLGIDDLAIKPADNLAWLRARREPLAVGNTPAESSHLGKWALLLEPIKSGKVGRAAIAGCLFARVSAPGTYPHPFCDIADGSFELTSNWFGAAEILAGPWTHGGDDWAYLRIGNWTSPTWPAKATSAITAGGNGTANIYHAGTAQESVTVSFDWMDLTEDIPDTTEMLVRYYRDAQKWRPENAACSS